MTKRATVADPLRTRASRRPRPLPRRRRQAADPPDRGGQRGRAPRRAPEGRLRRRARLERRHEEARPLVVRAELRELPSEVLRPRPHRCRRERVPERGRLHRRRGAGAEDGADGEARLAAVGARARPAAVPADLPREIGAGEREGARHPEARVPARRAVHRGVPARARRDGRRARRRACSSTSCSSDADARRSR